MQFAEQSSIVPVQGSISVPQKPALHVSGVQQEFESPPPPTPHIWPEPQLFSQV